jgi:hypothetical protein
MRTLDDLHPEGKRVLVREGKELPGVVALS